MVKVSAERPLVIAGPCMAESWDVMAPVAERLKALSEELGFDYVFKSSFDKANRTSYESYRGPGLDGGLELFRRIKKDFGLPVLTDVHETSQVAPTAEVCDVLQIPAFLCRQTDLVVSAAKTGRTVNVKKGQFLAPGAMAEAVGKARAVLGDAWDPRGFLLTERGASFGYGNLVVDMRSLAIMADTGCPVIFDITHSTQLPAAGGTGGATSGAQRRFAPVLARAAAATGYLAGFFLEVHPRPTEAQSDKDAQLSPDQAEALLRQIIPIWSSARALTGVDSRFV